MTSPVHPRSIAAAGVRSSASMIAAHTWRPTLPPAPTTPTCNCVMPTTVTAGPHARTEADGRATVPHVRNGDAMSFLNKAKEKATQLAQQAKEKVNNIRTTERRTSCWSTTSAGSSTAHAPTERTRPTRRRSLRSSPPCRPWRPRVPTCCRSRRRHLRPNRRRVPSRRPPRGGLGQGEVGAPTVDSGRPGRGEGGPTVTVIARTVSAGRRSP